MSRYYSVILGLICLVSCSETKQTNYEKIEVYLEEEHGYNLKGYNHVVVVNEQGDCMNCNNSFAKAMAKNIVNKKVLFLICTPGLNVDISGYINTEKSNVLLDYHNKFGELNLTDHCAIIELGEQKIDTIIQIDVKNVSENINTVFR